MPKWCEIAQPLVTLILSTLDIYGCFVSQRRQISKKSEKPQNHEFLAAKKIGLRTKNFGVSAIAAVFVQTKKSFTIFSKT